MNVKQVIKEQLFHAHCARDTRNWDRYREIKHWLCEYFPLRHNIDVIINKQG